MTLAVPIKPVIKPSMESAPDSSGMLSRLEKKLLHYTSRGIEQFNMIQKGDRVLVCVSGGKDSMTMLWLLNKLKNKLKKRFEIFAFVLDQSQPGWDDSSLRAHFEAHDIPYEIMTKNTYKVVKEKIPDGKTYCSLCSRLRRGNIYQYARDHGFNKVALGHHREDLIETFLMSVMFNGRIRTMPPKLLTDSKDLIVIRPMCYLQEQDIKKYAQLKQFPIIPCSLCGSQPNLMRQKVKGLLQAWSKENPKIPSNMLRALSQVNVSHLMDKNLWDFSRLEENV